MRGWTLNVYLLSALVFVVGLLVQVFLTGMVVVATLIDWSAHRLGTLPRAARVHHADRCLRG